MRAMRGNLRRAARATGVLRCADLATKVQRKHHESMMNALMHLMGAVEEPRVQSHAASAIVNFCEGLGEDDGGNIVGRYLQPLSERLLVLLQGGNQLAVEAALTATSSIADGVGVRPPLPCGAMHMRDRTLTRVPPARSGWVVHSVRAQCHNRLWETTLSTLWPQRRRCQAGQDVGDHIGPYWTISDVGDHIEHLATKTSWVPSTSLVRLALGTHNVFTTRSSIWSPTSDDYTVCIHRDQQDRAAQMPKLTHLWMPAAPTARISNSKHVWEQGWQSGSTCSDGCNDWSYTPRCIFKLLLSL